MFAKLAMKGAVDITVDRPSFSNGIRKTCWMGVGSEGEEAPVSAGPPTGAGAEGEVPNSAAPGTATVRLRNAEKKTIATVRETEG